MRRERELGRRKQVEGKQCDEWRIWPVLLELMPASLGTMPQGTALAPIRLQVDKPTRYTRTSCVSARDSRNNYLQGLRSLERQDNRIVYTMLGLDTHALKLLRSTYNSVFYLGMFLENAKMSLIELGQSASDPDMMRYQYQPDVFLNTTAEANK